MLLLVLLLKHRNPSEPSLVCDGVVLKKAPHGKRKGLLPESKTRMAFL